MGSNFSLEHFRPEFHRAQNCRWGSLAQAAQRRINHGAADVG
jgi:hypothetical protein